MSREDCLWYRGGRATGALAAASAAALAAGSRAGPRQPAPHAYAHLPARPRTEASLNHRFQGPYHLNASSFWNILPLFKMYAFRMHIYCR